MNLHPQFPLTTPSPASSSQPPALPFPKSTTTPSPRPPSTPDPGLKTTHSLLHVFTSRTLPSPSLPLAHTAGPVYFPMGPFHPPLSICSFLHSHPSPLHHCHFLVYSIRPTLFGSFHHSRTRSLHYSFWPTPFLIIILTHSTTTLSYLSGLLHPSSFPLGYLIPFLPLWSIPPLSFLFGSLHPSNLLVLSATPFPFQPTFPPSRSPRPTPQQVLRCRRRNPHYQSRLITSRKCHIIAAITYSAILDSMSAFLKAHSLLPHCYLLRLSVGSFERKAAGGFQLVYYELFVIKASAWCQALGKPG